jgi:hypothetical protein
VALAVGVAAGALDGVDEGVAVAVEPSAVAGDGDFADVIDPELALVVAAANVAGTAAGEPPPPLQANIPRQSVLATNIVRKTFRTGSLASLRCCTDGDSSDPRAAYRCCARVCAGSIRGAIR